jgi:hypothetical protein
VALEDALSFHLHQADWHNQARTRLLLLRAGATASERLKQIEEIAEIYRSTVTDAKRIESIRCYPIRLINAREVLIAAINTAEDMGRKDLTVTLGKLITSLERASSE